MTESLPSQPNRAPQNEPAAVVKSAWQPAIDACLENGRRLLDDAKHLSEHDRFATARAIAILAQEEFAKGYLLRLVAEGVVPDCDEVVRASRDHVCKHLVGVVMLHLYLPWETIYARLGKPYEIPKEPPVLPRNVADALNILCHEKLLRWRDPINAGLDDYDYDALAKRVWKGAVDRAKQDMLYVSVSRGGKCGGIPNCAPVDATDEITLADTLREVAEGQDVFAREVRQHIHDALRLILEKLSAPSV